MTLAAIEPRILFTGTGTLGPFSLSVGGAPLRFTSNSHIRVTRYSAAGVGTLLVQGTDYTLTGGPNAGSLLLTAPQTVLLSTERLLVERSQPFTQDLALGNAVAFPSTSVEARLDKLTEFVQDLAARVARAVTLFPTDTNAAPSLPAAADRALKYMAFDGDGDPIATTGTAGGVVVSAEMDDVIASATTDEALARLNGVLEIADITALRAKTWSGTGRPDIVLLRQSWAAGDGGGVFRWDGASVVTDDGGTIIKETATTTGRWLRQLPAGAGLDVRWFGATTTGAGFTAAAQAAITAAGVHGMIDVPYGAYTLTSALTLLTGQTLRGTRGRPTITKGVAGNMIDASAAQTRLEFLDLRGAGATYTNTSTDRGVVYTNGANAYQSMRDVWIYDCAGPCVEFTVADAGNRSRFFSCIFQRTTSTNPAVVMPTAADTTGGREFHECRGDGGWLLRFNASANTRIIGGDTVNLDFGGSDGAALRAVVNGVRIATGGSALIVRGNDTALTGCIIAGGVQIEGAASRNVFANNALLAGATYTDNSTSTGNNVNHIDYGFYSPTVSWLADTTNPSLGNGTLTCRVTRRGRKLKVDIALTMGSTTTFGTGPWYFELPAPFSTWVATASVTGALRIFDSGTAWLLGSCAVSGGARRIYMFPTNGAAGVQSTIPITWASSDSLTLSVEYEIS